MTCDLVGHFGNMSEKFWGLYPTPLMPSSALYLKAQQNTHNKLLADSHYFSTTCIDNLCWKIVLLFSLVYFAGMTRARGINNAIVNMLRQG